MKKNKKIITIATVLIILVIILILCVTVSMKKTFNENKAQEQSLGLTEKFAENESIRISVNNISYADKYLILEYSVKSKNEEKPFFLENYANKNEFGFNLDRSIKIDGETINLKNDFSDQISYKVSDNEAKIYDIIEVNNLSEKFNLEINFFENDNTVYISEDDVEEYILTEEDKYAEDLTGPDDDDSDNIDPDDYERESANRPSVNDFSDEESQEELIEDTEEEFLEENATEEDYEEVEGEYIETLDKTEENLEEEPIEETEENIEESATKEEKNEKSEVSIIGTISGEVQKEDISKDTKTTENKEEYNQDNFSIKDKKIIKTPFETFIIVETQITNLDYEIIDTKQLGDPSTYKIDIQDKDGNSIKYYETQNVKVVDENRTNIYEIESEEFPENLTANIKTIIAIEKDTQNPIRLQSYYYSYEFTNDDIETAMNNKEWNKIENKKYEKENGNGGKVEITEIETTDSQILFHYNTTGFIPSAEAIILLRNNTKKFNVFYPDIIKENIIGFNIKDNSSFSYIDDEELTKENIGDKKDLEFTLIEGLEIKKIGEGLEIKI